MGSLVRMGVLVFGGFFRGGRALSLSLVVVWAALEMGGLAVFGGFSRGRVYTGRVIWGFYFFERVGIISTQKSFNLG
jgi:hypothetical protein